MLTSEQRIIHFTNTAFSATIDGNGDQEFQLTPIVTETNGMCGIGLVYNGSILDEYGPYLPRDLITSWRATKILQTINWKAKTLVRRRRKWIIHEETLLLVYNGAMRNPPREDREKHRSIMVEMMGRRKYEKLFSLPIPEIIVNGILEGQKRDCKPCLLPLREELFAGTIKKDGRFHAFGIR